MAIVENKHPFHVWLGLGGNLGNVKASMKEALHLFEARDDTSVLNVSHLYKTPPWGKTDQPWFYNACAEILTTLEPEALLSFSLAVEQRMQRQRLEKWGPRTLDIDLLIYDDLEVFKSDRLILPHPHITQRAFVLEPLSEIAPDMMLLGKNIAQWAREKKDTGVKKLNSSMHWWKENS